MRSAAADVFHGPLVDGIDQLAAKPGIYAVLNRVTRKMNVGQSMNMKHRCVLHRSQIRAGGAANMRMRLDTERNGDDCWFYFALQELETAKGRNVSRELDLREIWWAIQLQVHDEDFGYLSEAGHCRTLGAKFRDRERKLMRPNSEKYQLLPGIHVNDPISRVLLSAWIPGS